MPPQALKMKLMNGAIPVYYRPNSSDERVLQEVVNKRCYRKKKFEFDVEPGERWLDLGANIGAFAVYCRIRGAEAECYEPDPVCFKLLRRNAPMFALCNCAVSNLDEPYLPMWSSSDENTHTRGSLFPQRMRKSSLPFQISNIHAHVLCQATFDGVKMDIEGSEFGLIDEWLMPKCEKLVLEYHTSRDPDLDNLDNRLGILKEQFEEVYYPPEYSRLLVEGGKPFADRLIFCKGSR